MRRRALLAVPGGMVLLGAVVAAWPSLSRRTASKVPTLRLEPEHFVHQVYAEGNLKAKESTPLSVPVEAPEGLKLAWVAADGSRVREGDPVVRFDPSEVDKRLADGLADRATAASRARKLEAESGAQERNLERDARLARTELEASRDFPRRDPDVFSRIQILEAEIDEGLAAHREEHAVDARRRRERLARSDMDLVNIETRKADLKVGLAEQLREALDLFAPHGGIVLVERDWRGEKMRVGQQVWPGQAVARIPRLDAMEADVYVLEEDAGGLTVGAPVTVTVEARPDLTYRAAVERIEQVAKPRVKGSPIQYFGVTLSLERTDPEVMKPGQRVQAVIRVAEREGALALPHQAVAERDGKRFAWRLRDGRFEWIEVKLGIAGLGRVVVESGLEAGDVVALRDPGRSLAEVAGRGGAGLSGAASGPEGRP